VRQAAILQVDNYLVILLLPGTRQTHIAAI